MTHEATLDGAGITADRLRSFVRAPVPLPCHGDTHARWERLTSVARTDLPLAKLVEPHLDALAILAELDRPTDGHDDLWAVWAAEPPFAVLDARPVDGGWVLDGRKAFCSGASLVTRALVTARTAGGPRLFAIDLSSGGITVDESAPSWASPGMMRADTHTLAFTDVRADPVGHVDDYTRRPGFWWGAIGIAACWLGGALGVADTLEHAADRLDAHGRAHLGAVRARLLTLTLALEAAAHRVDADEERDLLELERLAQTLRATAADTVDDVISWVGRALGPGPLAFDAAHAARVADLQVFVRQHHAERDLERLGSFGGPVV
jgi:alkylation response protein AidB-like acyl-CoA dehydrogenase